ncbi:MAG TPA: hypothetical protein VLY04_05905 [Bryobacteraceae bacterium]|nr:hypothetical protein [Bryobacteraceae bacterium]
MNLTPFLVVWIILALAVGVMIVWRKMVASHEDDNLHVMEGVGAQQSAMQTALSQKLDFIDKWGKLLTIIAVAYGVLLGLAYVYQGWIATSRLGA